MGSSYVLLAVSTMTDKPASDFPLTSGPFAYCDFLVEYYDSCHDAYVCKQGSRDRFDMVAACQVSFVTTAP